MRKLGLILGLFLLVSMLAGSSLSYGGQWTWVHGNASFAGSAIDAQHEPSGTIFMSWAPYDYSNPNCDDCMISYVVPSSGSCGANRVAIKFISEQAPPYVPAYIAKVAVYNGNDLIKTITGNWGGTGYQELSFDLDRMVIFNKGLGISMAPLSPSSASQNSPAKLKIVAVGAFFAQGAITAATGNLLMGDQEKR